MQVWTIGPCCTQNLCPFVRISQRTARLAGRMEFHLQRIQGRQGNARSEKCRWYQLVDEFMSDKAHIISHAHASAMELDGPKSANASFTNTTDHKSGEGTSKSPEPKRKDDIFLERCLGRIEESSKSLIDSLKASDDMKMTLLMSIQQTMQKLVEKL